MKHPATRPPVLTLLLVAACTLSGSTPRVHAAGKPTLAPETRSALDAVFDDPKFANAFWGVRIETLDGTVLYDRLGHKQFVPASNLKLFTSAAALEVLGPDFTYETHLEAVGDIDGSGTLDGDLVIVGSGDPSLGAWHPDKDRDSHWLLGQWVEKLQSAGIRRVTGDVIGDGRCFTRQYYGPFWDYYDLPYWYAAGSSGLAIEENGYRCVIKPGENVGDPAVITYTPQTSYISIVNETRTVDPGGKSNADSTWNLTEGNVKRFTGTIALDKEQINERGSVWDGARYAAHLLLERMERESIPVEGGAYNIRNLPEPRRAEQLDTAPRRRITTYVSPPLRELVKVINKPSHNFFADQVIRTMGLREESEGSFEAGVRVVKKWLETIGAPQPDTVQMYDGSGLARDDFFQPRQMCHLLRHMRTRSTAATAFHESLPVAGVDGSLGKRMTGEKTKGNVRAKTGYISNVRCLSGYVTTADGCELVFAMMCNQYTVPTREVNAAQDRACEILASCATTPAHAVSVPAAGD